MSGQPVPKTFREPKAPVRMKAKSSKTAARDRRYARERVAFLAANPVCVAQLPHVCTGRATEVHHMAGRAASVFFDQALWKALCSACHGWVTDHPEGAVARGLSVRRNGVQA